MITVKVQIKIRSQIKRKIRFTFLFRYIFVLPIRVFRAVFAQSSSVSNILWEMEDDDGIMMGSDQFLSLALE